MTQDIWRQSQPAVDEIPAHEGEAADTPRPARPWEAVGQRPSGRKVVLLTVGLVVAALATLLVVAPGIRREIAPAFGGDDDPSGWTAEVKAHALEGCTIGSGGLEAACRCIVEESSAIMSEDEYLRLGYDVAASGQLPPEYAQLASYCVGSS